jgi:predicted small lipoprotein YifL
VIRVRILLCSLELAALAGCKGPLYQHQENYFSWDATHNRWNEQRVADEASVVKATGIDASDNEVNVLSGNKAQAGKNK